jgi:hypothetical protein
LSKNQKEKGEEDVVMALNGSGLILPTLTRDKIRTFLRWLNTANHPTQQMVYERKDTDELANYIIGVVKSITEQAEVNKFGVVTPEAIEAAFAIWCNKQTSRIKALDFFHETSEEETKKKKE